MAESKFNKRITRYTASKLNGILVGVEDVVKLLQFEGPSWTGLYSNSWQIKVGNEKRTGTRRAGNAQPVQSPKMTVKTIRQGQKRGFIEWEISNLARSAPYAEDRKLGRFRRGKAGTKVIGNEPRTALGKRKFKQSGSGRKGGLTMRKDIGGGTPGILSGTTAQPNVDWLKTTLRGGKLKGKLRLQFKKGKSK
tara:strand:+ start:40 stop:618 length:579 start_codon:yes stop_codon:yes gene_type:complete